MFRRFKLLFDSHTPSCGLRAVLFGSKGILVNSIAWLLRRFPIFGVFGRGAYRLIYLYVDDLAGLAVEQAFEDENIILDAIGLEMFTYQEVVQTIGRIIGKKRPIIPVPPFSGWLAAWISGKMVGDVLLTKEEIYALKDDRLYVDSPPTGNTRLTEWIRENADFLGRSYQSELARRIHHHSEK